jgi:hypothetical protein
MRTPSSLLAAVAASMVALASGKALAAEAWNFTKSPAPWASHAVGSSALGVDAMVVNVSATGIGLARVTRMAFMVTGTLHTAEVGNYQLVYYPNGLSGSGLVVGSSSGSSWAPGITTSIVSIALASPLALSFDSTTGISSGVFMLRADVSAARSFFFQPQLQTVTVENAGVERPVTTTGDLPLLGDSFYVN